MDGQVRVNVPEPDGAPHELTLHEAAAELGVHYMTAYRYVRLGSLDANKLGSGWRIRRDDLDAFRSTAPADGQPRPAAAWAERLESRLLAGDSGGAWGVIEAALASGHDPRSVYLEIIGPAMVSIGAKWQDGHIDISAEHQASGVVARLVGRLGPRFVRRGRTLGTVVVGAPAGERHALPLSMVADLIRLEGFEVADLGVDMPPTSFALAASGHDRLVAVGISVTSPSCLPAAQLTVEAVRQHARGVPVMVGGSAIQTQNMADEIGADYWVEHADQISQCLSTVLAGRV